MKNHFVPNITTSATAASGVKVGSIRSIALNGVGYFLKMHAHRQNYVSKMMNYVLKMQALRHHV